MTSAQEQFREPFTAENTVFLFVDHQERMLAAVGDQPQEQLRASLKAVAAAARALDVPIVLSSASTEMIGPTIPELAEALEGVENIERTLISAWEDECVRAAVPR